MKKPVKIKKARGGDLQQLVCPPVPQCFAPLGDRRLGSSEAESKKQLTKDHWNHSVLQGQGFPGLSSTFQDIPHKKRNEIFFKATFSKLTWLLYKRELAFQTVVWWFMDILQIYGQKQRIVITSLTNRNPGLLCTQSRENQTTKCLSLH